MVNQIVSPIDFEPPTPAPHPRHATAGILGNRLQYLVEHGPHAIDDLPASQQILGLQ